MCSGPKPSAIIPERRGFHRGFPMFADRLVREVEKRLLALPDVAAPVREEVLDALREEIARERRRVDPTSTVENERTRRVEEETLREILEAINRQASLKDTIDEV